MVGNAGSSKAVYIVGGIALVGLFIYCCWKLNEILSNVEDIADRLTVRPKPKQEAPVDVTANDAPTTSNVVSIHSENAPRSIENQVLTICPDSQIKSSKSEILISDSLSEWGHSDD